jgi:glycosyltransferase involved in cell wall biosynthesis
MRHLPYFLPLSEGAPATHEDPETEGLRAGRPYFLFVGRLVKLKGAQGLVDAFQSYEAADLVIAGDGSYGDELRRRARGAEHIRFLGRVHPSALKALYRNAVATLVPSLVYETFGLITLESLSQRTPVIATALGAVGELARASGGGLTYGSREQLVAAMEELRRDPALRDELGRRGHDAWVERWSEEPHVEAYLAAVDAAKAGKHGGVRAAVGAAV